METLLQDFRFAVRSLMRTPAFTVAAVLTLALGIGANSAIFTIVDGVLLRPTPVVDIDRVMLVWQSDRRSGSAHEPSSLPDVVDYQQRSRTFTQFATFAGVETNLTHEGTDPQRLAALAVSDGYFSLLGIQPLAGRLLELSETQPNGPRGLLISEALWDRLFSRADSAIGSTLRLNDVEWTVAGVLPNNADFGVLQVLNSADYARAFAQRGGRTRVDIWMGLRADASTLPRDTHPLIAIGRLAAGSTREQAQTEMSSIMATLEAAYPSNEGRGAVIQPLSDVVFSPVRSALWTLLGAVALVLVVACANVANLLLVRAAARTREVTVRVALGASTRRLTQQFLVEGAVLTAVGAALGIALALGAVDTLKALAPVTIPRVEGVTLDLRVLGATLGMCVLVALSFGLLPALQARSQRLHAALQGAGGRSGSGGRDATRVRGALIVSELAMAAMLMVGAGLLIQSLWRLQSVDLGFESAGVLKAEYQLPASRYPRDFAIYPRWAEVHQFNETLQTRLEALPGVNGVTIAAYNPLNAGTISSIRVVGREAEAANWPEPAIRMVGGEYFSVMDVGVRAGRALAATDDAATAPVVVINEAAQQRFFEGRDPLGAQINLWGGNRAVVGVVVNERFRGAQEDVAPAVYLPIAQMPVRNGGHSVMLRVDGDPASYAASVRSIFRDLDPLLPVFGVEPLTTTFANSVGQQRFTMFVLGLFAVVALLLAAVGVHGVLSYSVAQRTSEIGIRMALGADQMAVRRLVLGQGATFVGIGLAIGLVGALGLSQLLAALLFGIGPRDPVTFAIVASVLASVAMVASYLPARRAARIEPITALRNE